MSIEYKTEAKVVIYDREKSNLTAGIIPVALMWKVGDDKVKLVQSSGVMPDVVAKTFVLELSASQLLQIADLAPRITRDLGDQSRHPSAA